MAQYDSSTWSRSRARFRVASNTVNIGRIQACAAGREMRDMLLNFLLRGLRSLVGSVDVVD